MSSRSMSLDVLVRLRDKLSGPLQRIRALFKSLGDMARKIGMLGAAVAAISFMGPLKEAAAFQQKLLDIAGTAELTGRSAFKFTEQMRSQYEALALVSGQFSDTIAESAGQMFASGLDRKLIDGSIGDIARATTAANAEMKDMTQVATSLLQTLKTPVSELNNSFGALITSGRLGAFEMKDMAQYFPSLTGKVAKFGVTGREAVDFLGTSLQIVRKGTSDSAEAANNLGNFLAKISSPETAKNFRKMGVDIDGVMKSAAIQGINPIEAVIRKISDLTKASGVDIATMMNKAKAGGLEGADVLNSVREQLEKIHGAGKLGALFGDEQVMNALIPILANLDEYKRIKEAVSKATGAIIDPSFQTNMEGLNYQLITFQEIGTQAAREVGFAFGAWLPEINAHLSAGLKWYREWNTETGGLGTKLLTMAGGGVLAAAAIGALGLALPLVGAGFAALAALISPLGIAIAAIAAGSVYLYKNWGTYGPRLTRLWDNSKRGFLSFVDQLRNGIGKALSVGREFADRYGPMIAAGFNSAWNDVKGGWKNLQSFFKSIMDGMDFKFDMSGITIDDVKIAAFKALDKALGGIKTGWQALKDFGTGFAPYLDDIGKNIGSFVKSVVSIGESLASISSFDGGPSKEFFKSLGSLAGGAVQKAAQLLADIAATIANTTKWLTDLAKQMNIQLPWEKLIPGANIFKLWNDLAEVMERVKSAMTWFSDGKTAKPGDILPNGTPAGNPDDGSDRDASLNDMLNPLKPRIRIPALDNWKDLANAGKISNVVVFPKLPRMDKVPVVRKPKWSDSLFPTEDETPGKQSSLSNDNRFARALPSSRSDNTKPAEQEVKVEVGGNITVSVDQSGKIITSNNIQLYLKNGPNTGKVVGRI